MAAIVTAITGVFTEIGSWIITMITSMIDIFYVAESGLTFIGVLALMSLGIGVVWMIIGFVYKFIKFQN